MKNNPLLPSALKWIPPALEQNSIVDLWFALLDLVTEKMLLPKAKIGDLVVNYQSGAYRDTSSTGRFLNQSDVVELIV